MLQQFEVQRPDVVDLISNVDDQDDVEPALPQRPCEPAKALGVIIRDAFQVLAREDHVERDVADLIEQIRDCSGFPAKPVIVRQFPRQVVLRRESGSHPGGRIDEPLPLQREAMPRQRDLYGGRTRLVGTDVKEALSHGGLIRRTAIGSVSMRARMPRLSGALGKIATTFVPLDHLIVVVVLSAFCLRADGNLCSENEPTTGSVSADLKSEINFTSTKRIRRLRREPFLEMAAVDNGFIQRVPPYPDEQNRRLCRPGAECAPLPTPRGCECFTQLSS